MTWGTLFWYRINKLAFLTRGHNEEAYCKTFDRFSVPFIANHLRIEHYIIFQQNNAPIHSGELACK